MSSDFYASAAKLEALSPLSVLSRGYSILEKNGDAVSSASDINVGDKVTVVMHDGYAEAEINNVILKSE